jgi:hypothetical protein
MYMFSGFVFWKFNITYPLICQISGLTKNVRIYGLNEVAD